MKQSYSIRNRPMWLGRPASPDQLDRFRPAPELLAWVEQTIVASGEHAVLRWLSIAPLRSGRVWTHGQPPAIASGRERSVGDHR